jgi:predicted metal-dependent hydrolase
MMDTELIEIAGLSVELVRNPIKNLHIGVYPPTGRVRVAAPPAISEDAVRVAVVTRLGWIKKKQRELEGQARQPERRYVSGETHFVFGKPLRLLVQPNDKNRCAIRPGASDRLTMLVPAGSTTDMKARWMATWYRSQLREKAAPRVARWSGRLGVPMPRWGIRLMKTKWGSCNPEQGLVWLNLDLAKKPVAALDYVILHDDGPFRVTATRRALPEYPRSAHAGMAANPAGPQCATSFGMKQGPKVRFLFPLWDGPDVGPSPLGQVNKCRGLAEPSTACRCLSGPKRLTWKSPQPRFGSVDRHTVPRETRSGRWPIL